MIKLIYLSKSPSDVLSTILVKQFLCLCQNFSQIHLHGESVHWNDINFS